MPVSLCGILNITPDSFSDAGQYLNKQKALDSAKQMIDQGASMIDIGADSTRPGSICVGVEEEWSRLSPLVAELSRLTVLSVDTHHSEVARRALSNGAKIINDISAGKDREMFQVVAENNAAIVLMFSTCPMPHIFLETTFDGGIKRIRDFLFEKSEAAKKAGVDPTQIYIDPGMGRFISPNADDSLMVLDKITEIASLPYPLFLGISRKGFVVSQTEHNQDRDRLSAELAFRTLKKISAERKAILRVHNVAAHQAVL